MSKSFDVLVIGAGTGGYVAAIRAAQLGKTVAVVEKQSALGGTCLIWGCIPTKALLEHAHALKVIQQAAEWGVTIPSSTPAINMTQVHARKDKIVGGLTKGIEFLFKKNKITWVKGTARLAGPGRIEVVEGDKQTLEAKEIIIATGSAPRSVPSVTIDRARIITSDEAIHLKEVPKSLVILGSGAVGVEFASIYRRFGSAVTLIEVVQRLVPVEDEAVSSELEKSFKKQGITVLTGTKVTKATPSSSGCHHRGANAGWQDEHDYGRCVARRHGSRTCNDGVGCRGSRHRDGTWLYQGRRSLPHVGAGDFGDRRCHHARNGCAPAAGARVVDGGHHRRRADRRKAGSGAQLRPRARLHLLRSRDRERGPHGSSGKGARLRSAGRHLPLWRARSSEDGRGVRGVREDRCRQEVPMKCWACT